MANMLKWFTAILFPSCVISLTYCETGAYYIPLGDTHACELCRPGTFMPQYDHQLTQCFDCMKIEDDTLEILIEECDRKHDSVIHCVEGYYRRLPRNPREKERCQKCTQCSYPTLPCRTYEDTHCCMGDNYEVAPDKNGVPGCVEKPWLCRRGEYFDTTYFLCKECPSDTCMPIDYHSMTECNKCHSSSRENLPKHATIIQPCNSKHQAVVGCEDGFYFSHTMGHYNKDIGCSPCKTCSSDEGMYEGRECGRAHDTVCCPQPNMTVVNTSDGLECRELSTVSPYVPTTPTPRVTVCAENEYLYTDNSTRVGVCLPCPCGTFMNESNHANTACKSYTNLTDQQLSSSVHQKDTSQENAGYVGVIVAASLACLVIGGFLGGVICFVCHNNITRLKYSINQRHPHPGDSNETAEMDKLMENDNSGTGSSRSIEGESMPLIKNQTGLHSLNCERNPMHPQFIPVREFSRLHLPEKWRNELVEKYVKATADLTVNVIYASKKGGMGKYADRQYASGVVYRMIRTFTEQDGKSCPCKTCRKIPEKAMTCWGEVEVITSTRCVYNDDDVQHTKCCLWNDSGDDSGSWL